jgi:hypothetical protein
MILGFCIYCLKILFLFRIVALHAHFIKSLADVQKCSRTILITLQCVVYDVGYTVDLFSGIKKTAGYVVFGIKRQ